MCTNASRPSGRGAFGEFLVCAMAALAAVKGSGMIAEAVLELTTQSAERFLSWLGEQ